MSIAGREATVEERITALEQRLGKGIAAHDRRVDGLEARLRLVEATLLGRAEPVAEKPSRLPSAPPRAAASLESRRAALAGPSGRVCPEPRASTGATAKQGQVPAPRTSVTPASSSPSPCEGSLGDLVGGRLLAWIGGVATLLGIVLFLALAISHGWIGEEARVVLAGVASAGLMAAGVWLHDHRGRTEAARAMVGSATAGLFATLVVAGEVYALIPAVVGVSASMLVGGLATRLAIRWAGQVVGALGLMGALLSPVLVGAEPSLFAVAVLAVAATYAMAVVVRQGWTWLGLAAVLICAPQWASLMLDRDGVALALIVLIAFGGLGLGGAIAAQIHRPKQGLQSSWALLVPLNALVVATIGYVALRHAGGVVAGELWLAALGAVHAAVGLWRERRVPISLPMRQLLIAIGVILADVAFGLSAGGLVLAVGSAVAAIGFACLTRRTAPQSRNQALLGLGLGAHIALVLTRALLDAPPSELASGDAQLLGLVSVSTLAATSMACARIVDPARRTWRVALDSLGLLALAYLTAGALDGAALVAAWAFEGVALAEIARSTEDDVARYDSLGFLGGAALHAVVLEAPPDALLTGVGDLASAAIALGALAIAAARGASLRPARSAGQQGLVIASGTTLLYLASVAVITAFQPGSSETINTVLDLTVRQQGQVLLSALWSIVGLVGLIVGLRARLTAIRNGGLVLLLVAVAKVFLYDLSTLTSIYRVISFVVLGLLLLAGAYAYQRLRPPPQPDMRTLHPSQR